MRKKSSKEKRLEILKTYAEYHIEGKSVYIDKIILDEPYKPAVDKIEEVFDSTWQANGIDTCVNVGKKIYEDNPVVSS
jgi:hypothetical protein